MKNTVKYQPITLINTKKIIVVLLLIIVSGIFFRLHNLNSKIYWLDESFTSLSISAYSRTDVKERLITGKIIDISTIKEYQFPNDLKNYRGTIQGIIEDEPQHTPFYFLTARLWVKIFGDSIINIRILSALTGILCLPLMYLLCRELFELPLISWLATAFMAVSPFHVLYSQEARPFSLWTLTTLLSYVALLKAQKQSSIANWLLYSLSLIVSFYTFLFSLLTCFAHSIYILFSEKLKPNKTTISFILASLLAIGFFMPWIIVLVNNPPNNYTSFPPSSITAYPKAWIRNLSLPFIDFSINADSGTTALIFFLIYLLFLVTFLFLVSIYLVNKSPKKVCYFLLSILIIPTLILLLHDFGKGGQMSTRANYLIPSLLSIQIIIANYLGNKIIAKKRSFWLGITGILLSFAIASCLVMTTSDVWWNKAEENIHHRLAAIVNNASQPLIISDVLTDDEYIRPFSLSHYLDEKAKFMFLLEPTNGEKWQKIAIPTNYDVFLYAPSESLKTYLEAEYNLVPLFERNELYCDCTDETFYRLVSIQ